MRLLLFIFTFQMLISCNRSHEVEGIWIATHSFHGESPERLDGTRLFDFEDGKLFVVTIRDYAAGNNDTLIIDTSSYDIKDSTLIAWNEELSFHQYNDSLVLVSKSQKMKLILKRLSSRLKNPEITPTCFKGNYYISSDNYRDSVFFINDSLMIYTGEYNLNYPASKWSIEEYKGFQFFNEHNELRPVAIIRSCDDSSIKLDYPAYQANPVELKSYDLNFNKASLIATWSQVDYTSPNLPPPPSNYNMADLFLMVQFDSDSATIREHGRTEKLLWNVTDDGKRIYFIDKILKPQGSWKIKELNDSTLVVRIVNYIESETIELKKIKTTGNNK